LQKLLQNASSGRPNALHYEGCAPRLIRWQQHCVLLLRA
jgi:hypothetical protein